MRILTFVLSALALFLANQRAEANSVTDTGGGLEAEKRGLLHRAQR
jgi:hypothetical protein